MNAYALKLRSLRAVAIGANRLARRCHQASWNARWQRHNAAYRGALNDLFIVGYPKSGLTWMSALVFQLCAGEALEGLTHIGTRVHFIESKLSSLEPSGSIDDIAGTRLFKTHLHYRNTPKGPGKYIYVVRHGLDVAVSYFHQHRRDPTFRASIDEFATAFIKGGVDPGDWFEHLYTWVDNRSSLRLLVVSYESLLADPATELGRISRFCETDIDRERCDEICANTTLSALRAIESKLDPFAEMRLSGTGQFFRRGTCGQWRTSIGGDVRDMFRRKAERYSTKMKWDSASTF